MIIDFEKSRDFFESNSLNYVCAYLDERGIPAESYREYIKKSSIGFLVDNLTIVNEEEYVVDCFLGSSDDYSYDIKKANLMAEIEEDDICAVAMFCGGDLICLHKNNDKVYLLPLMEDEPIEIGCSWDDFINRVDIHDVDPNN